MIVVFIVTLLFGGVHCEHEDEDTSNESVNGTGNSTAFVAIAINAKVQPAC